MDYYFVAKTKEAGFVGQLTLDEIARRFHDGQIGGDYVATKSVGPSYSQLLKSGGAVWISVAELIANPLPQNSDILLNSPNDKSETVGADAMTPKMRKPFLIIALLLVLAVAGFLLWSLLDPVKINGCHSISVEGHKVDVPPGAVSFDMAKGASSYHIELTYNSEGCIKTAKATKSKE